MLDRADHFTDDFQDLWMSQVFYIWNERLVELGQERGGFFLWRWAFNKTYADRYEHEKLTEKEHLLTKNDSDFQNNANLTPQKNTYIAKNISLLRLFLEWLYHTEKRFKRYVEEKNEFDSAKKSDGFNERAHLGIDALTLEQFKASEKDFWSSLRRIEKMDEQVATLFAFCFDVYQDFRKSGSIESQGSVVFKEELQLMRNGVKLLLEKGDKQGIDLCLLEPEKRIKKRNDEFDQFLDRFRRSEGYISQPLVPLGTVINPEIGATEESDSPLPEIYFINELSELKFYLEKIGFYGLTLAKTQLEEFCSQKKKEYHPNNPKNINRQEEATQQFQELVSYIQIINYLISLEAIKVNSPSTPDLLVSEETEENRLPQPLKTPHPEFAQWLLKQYTNQALRTVSQNLINGRK